MANILEKVAGVWNRLIVDLGGGQYAPAVVDMKVLSGEEQQNARLRAEMKPVDEDVILETLHNAATTTGVGTAINVRGYKSVTLHCYGTINATTTMTVQGTIDNWANSFTIACYAVDQTTSTNRGTTFSAPFAVHVPMEGAIQQIRVNISAIGASSSITIKSSKSPR